MSRAEQPRSKIKGISNTSADNRQSRLGEKKHRRAAPCQTWPRSHQKHSNSLLLQVPHDRARSLKGCLTMGICDYPLPYQRVPVSMGAQQGKIRDAYLQYVVPKNLYGAGRTRLETSLLSSTVLCKVLCGMLGREKENLKKGVGLKVPNTLASMAISKSDETRPRDSDSTTHDFVYPAKVQRGTGMGKLRRPHQRHHLHLQTAHSPIHRIFTFPPPRRLSLPPPPPAQHSSRPCLLPRVKLAI